MSDFAAPQGVQLQLRSPTGEVLGYLSDSDESGKILGAELVERKIGGVENFKFRVSNDVDLPITRNTECYFFINGILRFCGQVVEIPLPDQNNPVLEIVGEGFYKNLSKKVINESYSSQTLSAIITDVASTYLGEDIDIFYDGSKINPPSISGITIEFKDKNLFDVFSTLLQIANYDYNNTKYRFYVDVEKDFVFELISEDYQAAIFEGYQYQAPEVSEDSSNVINRILAFRTTQSDPKTAEYVNAYEDTASQGRYGLFEKKITFPDYIDTTTIQKIAATILQRRSLPQTKIAIQNVEIFRPRTIFTGLGILDNGSGPEDWILDKDVSTQDQTLLRSDFRRGLEQINFGNYAISNKRNKIWEILAECDTLTGWGVSHISSTQLSLSTAKVLTGRRSMKFEVASGSYGEYIELTLENEILLPQAARAYVYFDSILDQIQVRFYDTLGNYKDLQFGVLDNILAVDKDVSTEGNMDVDTATETLELDINTLNLTTIDQWIKLSTEVLIGEIVNIKTIRITMLSDNVFSFYLDRLDAYADVCKFHSLQLEEVTYFLSSKLFSANLNFGELEDNIIDEIDKKVEDGDVALAIFSKQ